MRDNEISVPSRVAVNAFALLLLSLLLAACGAETKEAPESKEPAESKASETSQENDAPTAEGVDDTAKSAHATEPAEPAESASPPPEPVGLPIRREALPEGVALPASLTHWPEWYSAFPTFEAGPAEPKAGISEWTRQAGPGDTIVVGGYGFGDDGGRFEIVARTPEGEAYRKTVNALFGTPYTAVVPLPESMPAGVFVLRPLPGPNGAGGAAVFVNATESWWAFPKIAEAGGTLRVFGRNLIGPVSESSAVYLEPREETPGEGRWLPVEAANPYRVDVRLPESLPDGSYEVWIHNREGGAHGFSALHQRKGGRLATHHIKVQSDFWEWAGPTIDVTDHGAMGDGETDASDAIEAAFAEALQHERATVHFPEGVYLISRQLPKIEGKDDAGIRVTGEGKDETIIRSEQDWKGKGMMTVSGARVELRGFTLDFATMPYLDDEHRKRMKSKKILRFDPRFKEHLRMVDVRVDAQRSISAVFAGRTQAHIRDCEFIGRETQTGTMKNVLIEHSRFLARADAPVLMYWYGGWNIAVSHCEGRDFSDEPDSFDSGEGRFFTVSRYGQRHDNVYLGHNRTVDLSVREGNSHQNSGEQLMWEGINAYGKSAVVEAAPKSVTLAKGVGGKPWYSDAVVIAGKGIGQTRQVMSRKQATYGLSEPWDVVPDKTSVISIVDAINRIVVYRNELDAKPRAAQTERHNASSGINTWGASHTMIVDGNTFSQTRSGITTNSRPGKRDGVAHTFSHLYTDNVFTSNRQSLRHALGGAKPGSRGLTNFNLVSRGNTIEKAVEFGLMIRSGLWPDPERTALDGFVFERNVFADMPLAVAIEAKQPGKGPSREPMRGLFFQENQFDGETLQRAGTVTVNPPFKVHFGEKAP